MLWCVLKCLPPRYTHPFRAVYEMSEVRCKSSTQGYYKQCVRGSGTSIKLAPCVRPRHRPAAFIKCQSADGSSKALEPSSSSKVVRNAAAKAAMFTGSYAMIAGLALTIAPVAVFGLIFDASSVPRVWIQVGGILFTLIGMQYLGAGLNDQGAHGARSFYEATVWSRLFLVAGFTALVFLSGAPKGLLVLAALNLAGALGMARAIRATWGDAGSQQQQGKQGQGDLDNAIAGINDCNPLGM